MTLTAGTRLGPYEIVSLLGAGGMGEVYRARDTRLGRQAAVKILPAALAHDRDRLARFESEARAASALNHPNIVTIFDVGEANGVAWIGMELVEGETLRDLLGPGTLGPRRAVPLASQIAEGLARAHEVGIVHRDLKPGNILVSRQGRAKIVDFGLARMVATDAFAASQAPTAAERTEPGTVLGTVGYMAPEQVRGQTTDPRTDIFALGVILYEMLAGKRPFVGSTPAEVMTAILREDPGDLPAGTPPGLDRIVRRCLEKNPEARFQSSRDLAFALESLSTSGPSAAVATRTAAGPRRLVPLLIAGGGILAALALGYALRPLLETAPPSFSLAARLTNGPGRDYGAALSPDGKWVAYLATSGGRTNVWVKFLAGGQAANLTESSDLAIPSRNDAGGVDITPDGAAVVFSVRRPTGDPGSGAGSPTDTWIVNAPLGGSVRKFLSRAAGLRFSPDGRRIVFVVPGATQGDALVVADADGANPREILKARGGIHAHWPAWSPDGRFVYFIRGIVAANQEPSQIYRLPASGGSEPELIVPSSRRAVFPAPMPDGRGLVYAANVDTPDLALWWQPSGSGRPRRLTLGIGSYAEPRFSADGRALVASVVSLEEKIVAVSFGPEGPASERPLTDGLTGDYDPASSAAGKILVFSSSRSGSRNLWVAAPDGSGPKPLTTGNAIDERPAISPDGRSVAFVSDRGGERSIWTVPLEGGAPRRVAAASVLDSLSWSADGREILFAAPAGDRTGIFRVSVPEGRAAALPTAGSAHSPTWSPRGDAIAYLEPRGLEAGTALRFLDASGRPLARELPGGGPNLNNAVLGWSADGQRLAALTTLGFAPSELWLFDAKDGWAARKLLTLSGDVRGRGVCWSVGGETILVGTLSPSSNLVLFTRDR